MSRKKLLVLLAFLTAIGCGRAPNPQAAQTAASSPSTPAAQTASPQGQPASSAPAAVSAAEPAGNPSPAPDVYVIPAGTQVHVRLDQNLDTRRDRAGEGFEATLESPLTAQGRVVAPKGTRFHGRVLEAKESGRLKGRAIMELALDSFDLDGVSYPIRTRPDVRTSGSHKKRNIAFIGGGSGGGAAIGAIAGGGVGALVGAGAGAAAGVTTAAFTGRKNVDLPAETSLWFALEDRVSVRM
jgi:hypothetical protein